MKDESEMKLRENMLPNVICDGDEQCQKNISQEELLLWLWLSHAMGYGADCGELLGAFQSPKEIFNLRFSAELSNFVNNSQLEIMRAKEPEDFIFRIKNCEKLNIKIITYAQKNYPMALRYINSPPLVLYYRGDISLINKCFTFAFIGTRRPSAYGVEITRLLSKELANAGMLLISGMATGLDSECHKAALQCNTPTVACIAFGHDLCYPAAHKRLMQLIENNGVVLGEYPPGVSAQKPYFLQRNRLIAALSQGICVAEARKASGTMNTIGFALEYGKEVFAVPGSIFSPLSEGTHNMIKEGAKIAAGKEDILQWAFELLQIELKVETEKEKVKNNKHASPKFTGAKQQVYAALSSKAQGIEYICEKTNLSLPLVLGTLTELELEGYVLQQAGRQFVLQF